MKKYILILMVLFCSQILTQNAQTITQKINLENAIGNKVESTISKFLDPSQFIVVVNARLDFKPQSFNSSLKNNQQPNNPNPTYTFIPGLDMPSIPTDETIYRSSASGLSGFQYSSSLLYGLEIIIYLDETISTGSLQQNIKTLVENNIPEVIDCLDCIKFESLDILSSQANPGNSLSDRIAQLEQERRDAETALQNWRFEQLEDQLAIAEDARSEWEEQARNRENLRRKDDSLRMKNLEKIEKQYRTKQDSLYILTSIKLDEAVRGRILSEENTKKELLDLIKLQMQGENIDGLSADTQATLYSKRPIGSKNSIGGQTWLLIVFILILLTILLIVIMKNKKPVYLKPKTNNEASSNTISTQPTKANTDDEVVRSEMQSLRQSAVSMSVSEKAGANQIVKDWLDDKAEDAEDNNNEEQ